MKNHKSLSLSLTLLLLMAGFFNAKGFCDASFTFTPLNYNQYKFFSNQQQQSGYTYFHTWKGIGWGIPHMPDVTAFFNTPGNVTVCHTVTEQDSLGNVLCVDSQCMVLTIVFPNICIPNFYLQKDINVPLSVTFGSSIVNYTNLSLSWSFGDGQVVTGIAAPTHTYAVPGYYYACLYVNDTVQNCVDSACMNVYVDTVIQCSTYAYYTTRQQSFVVPEVKFTCSIPLDDLSIVWNFGDGTSSTLPTVNHSFPAFTTYYTCLTVTDTITGCTDSYCSIVTVDTCNDDIANFSFYPTPGSSAVGFNANTDNYLYNTDIVPLSVLWSFGDGTFDTIDFSPNHTYPALGDYYCCYYVNVPGCANQSSCDSVQVSCNLNAYFSSSAVNSLEQLFSVYNSSQNQHVGYEWSFGDGAISNGNFPLHIYTQQGFYNVCLIATDTILGCADTTCNVLLVSPWNDTICGFVFADNNLNGIQDAGELSMSGVTVFANGNWHTETDSSGHYEIVVPKNKPISITISLPGVYLFTLPFGSSFYQDTFINPHERHCGFDFGVVTNSVRVNGDVFADYNQNGVYNYPEARLSNQLIKVGNQLVPTDSYGSYLGIIPLGTTLVEPDNNGQYAGYPVLPVQWSVTATSPGAYITGKNFGIGVDTGTHDLAIELIPTSPVSTLNNPTYKLLVRNLGSTTTYYEAGIVSDNALVFDDLTYSSDANNPATHTTSWFSTQSGFQQKLFSAGYRATLPLVLNQPINHTAFVTMMIDSDFNTSNNIANTHQITVGSFDPNNKTSGNAGIGVQGYIANGTEIIYTINFQNTGTADAVNIIVNDVLSNNLDAASFRFLASSHNCDIRITGDTVYFRFSKIMLPDSFHNEPASHGWLSFAIKPKPNLESETQIFNNAAIFFDHNEPIITNTTLHTIDIALSIKNLNSTKPLLAYPNPFAETITVILNDSEGVDFDYTIVDLFGRKVAFGEISGQQPVIIDGRKFSAGTYLLSVYGKEGVVARAKLVAK